MEVLNINQQDSNNKSIEKTLLSLSNLYINEKDNVVISFNQGEVAAMYMGIVEFEIPTEVLEDIRK